MCAPHVAPDTMRAIVGVESAGNPYALNDNTTHRSYAPHDPQTALRIATALLRHGDSVDVGIAQVNSGDFAGFRVTAATMLAPCANLGVASRILVGDYARASASFVEPRAALWHAISAYNTGSLFAGKPYVDAVVAEALHAPTVPTISLLTSAPVRLAPLALVAAQPPRAGTTAVHAPGRRVRSHVQAPPTGLETAVRSAGITHSLASGLSHDGF